MLIVSYLLSPLPFRHKSFQIFTLTRKSLCAASTRMTSTRRFGNVTNSTKPRINFRRITEATLTTVHTLRIRAATITAIITRAITTRTKMACYSTTSTMISAKTSSNRKKTSMSSTCPSKNTVLPDSLFPFLNNNSIAFLETSRVYRGTTRGRPRGRGRPPLYGGRATRGSHSGHAPRGVNHLTTGSFQSGQRLIQPKIESPKSNEQQPLRNKRKPAKIKPASVSAQEEKPRRPGKILRSGRVSRKPRRDSETDFGSDNSDDSGAKDKETGSDDDEEFDLAQLGKIDRCHCCLE